MTNRDPHIKWYVTPFRNPLNRSFTEEAWHVRAVVEIVSDKVCGLGRVDRPLTVTRVMEGDSNQPTLGMVGRRGKGFTAWSDLVRFLRECHRIMSKPQYADVLGDHVDTLMNQLTDRVGGGPRIWLGPREPGDDEPARAAPLSAVDRAKGELVSEDGPSY